MKPLISIGTFVIGLCAIVEPTLAATLNVASFGDGTASKANFDSAYAAASAGDTILFPLSGSATWSATATIGKAITIVGNGTTLTQGAILNNGFFYVTGFTSTSLMRITGFTLNAVSHASARTCITVANGNLNLNQLRIDHNTFHYGYTQIVAYGAKGVIDHNNFNNPLKGIDFSAGSVAQANASWASMAAGTSDALFVEDNNFVYNGSYPSSGSQEGIGTENGGKLVIRNNNWSCVLYPASDTITPIMTHGSAAAAAIGGYWQIGNGARRGQSVVEIYNNTIKGVRVDFLCILRGSANLVHDNTLDAQTNNPRVILREEEDADPQWNPPRTTWPAEDQVHNSFFWNNTLSKNGVANTNYVEVYGDTSVIFIQQDRDYFIHAPQASGGREIFTGANGASGSFPTDGITYPTLGTMVFDASLPNAYFGYVPFTYPHPLTSGVLTVQAPPTNAKVKIQVTP